MILITGAKGFVGRNLIEKLNAKSIPLVALCKPQNESDNKNTLHLDLSKKGWTRNLPKGIKTVIHLAQSSQYSKALEAADDLVSVNVDATAELLDWSYKHKITQFIYTSTGSVYKSGNLPLKENAPCKPKGIYACSKYAAEILCTAYTDKLNISIARLFGIYGCNQKRGLIIDLVKKINERIPVTIAGSFGLKINPLHVDDCTDFLIQATKIKRLPLVFNLAGSKVISLFEICNIISSELEKKVLYKKVPGKGTCLIAENSLSRKIFGIKPQIDLDKGIRAMISKSITKWSEAKPF